MTYRKFKIDHKIYSQISIEDKKILKILEGAVKDVAKVYEQQLKDGFYPKGASKEKIEVESQHSAILSPFTLAILKNGQLQVIPYHEQYKELLLPIAQKIEKAAKICSNQSFKKYLLARAKSLRDGSYRDADVAWFNVKNCNIDFSVGPFERYLDKMFFIKRAFQAHVGIIDRERTKIAEKVKETLYSSAKISFDKTHSTDIPQKGVQLIIEHIPVSAGYMADALFSGEHFPCDLDLMQKLGSKVLIYRCQLEVKFKKIHYPIFKSIFEKKFATKYPKDVLFLATIRYIQLYELGRQLHKFEGSRTRLKDLYGVIDEANGCASGIQHAKYLLMKGLISQTELEAIIIIHIVWMFSDWLSSKKMEGLESYVQGNAIALNYYLTSEALKERGGIYWPNFTKLFFEIEELANKLVSILSNGSYQEAQSFISKNAHLSNFESFSKNLTKIATRPCSVMTSDTV